MGTAEGYRSVREGRTWAPGRRDRVVVAGPDAVTYLQGQLSQDVAALAVGASAWTLLLQPSGKLGWWLRVTRDGQQSFVLDGDPGSADGVAARLSRFLLRTDATVGVADPLDADADADAGTGTSGGGATDADRIEAGVPRGGTEIVDDVIPAELGQWLIDGSVSFTKGCYTGQELVARIDSRGGNVPRHLRGLVIDGGPVPPPGAEIVGPEGKVVGTVTSSAESAQLGAPVALAFVQRSVEPPAAVTVRWPGGDAPAEVRDLPLA